MLKDFQNFILKGNAIDLAVGVLIGAAFGKVVTAFTDGIINPVIGLLGGDPEVSLKLGILDVGLAISAVISLLITGAVLYFIFVLPMNRLRTLRAAPESPPAPLEPAAQEKLLMEIRDLLRERV